MPRKEKVIENLRITNDLLGSESRDIGKIKTRFDISPEALQFAHEKIRQITLDNFNESAEHHLEELDLPNYPPGDVDAVRNSHHP
jgi:hypothetical protein